MLLNIKKDNRDEKVPLTALFITISNYMRKFTQ